MSCDNQMRRLVQSSGYTAAEEDKPDRKTALAAGLQWLLHTEQSADSLIQHQGTVIHYRGGRYLSFCPSDGRALVVVNVSQPKRDVVTLELANPLEEGEMDSVAVDLVEAGVRPVSRWNGDGYEHGTFALAERPAPSLVAAVDRYKQGCTDHPSRSVFCECGWFVRGEERIVLPKVTAVFR